MGDNRVGWATVEVEKSDETIGSLPFANNVGDREAFAICPVGDVSKSKPSEDNCETKVETCLNPCGGDAIPDIF